MKRMKRLAALALSAVMLLSLAACAGNGGKKEDQGTAQKDKGGEPQASTQDTLTVAFRTEMPKLDPQFCSYVTGFALENLIFDRLVYKNAEGEIEPMLATSWEEIDPTTVRFHLRDDVVFQNGEKFTAADVKYTIARATTAPNSMRYFESFDAEGCKVIDDTTIDVKLFQPFAPIYNYLASARGNIVNEKTVEEMGEDAFAQNPVGTGKFTLESWTSGDRVVLKRNDGYWGEKPAYETFVGRFISEGNTREIELETGGVDIALNIDGDDAARLEEYPDTQVLVGPSYTTNYLSFDTKFSDLYKNIKLRQAMAEALDVPAIVDTVWGNTGTVADSVYSPQLLGYKAVGPVKYDPEEAKKLLAESGFDTSKTLQLSVTGSDYVSACEICCNMWKEIGLNVEIQMVDSAAYSTSLSARTGEYPLNLGQTNAAVGDPDHGLASWKGEFNTVHDDPEIYRLLDEGASENDPGKRVAIYEELQQKCWDYYGTIPLAFSNVLYGVRNNVKNLDTDPAYCPDFSLVTFQ